MSNKAKAGLAALVVVMFGWMVRAENRLKEKR